MTTRSCRDAKFCVSTLFRNKYRIESTRLRNWDYTHGTYFITICTRNRINFFGEIKKDKINLSKIGEVARQCWLEIPSHFPSVVLDEWVIMPNHVHGILTIHENNEPKFNAANEYCGRDAKFCVSTIDSFRQRFGRSFGPQSKNLASVIRGFKVGVKKWTTMNNEIFDWQPSYYEHIIRNEIVLKKIRRYIQNNPANWLIDPESFRNV